MQPKLKTKVNKKKQPSTEDGKLLRATFLDKEYFK